MLESTLTVAVLANPKGPVYVCRSRTSVDTRSTRLHSINTRALARARRGKAH